VQLKNTPATNIPLINAVTFRHLLVTALLVDHGANVEVRDTDGKTLLQIAISRRHADMIGSLLRRGLDVNAPAPNGDTPLLEAVYRGEDAAEVIRALLDGGANIETANREGKTPLRVAAGLAEPTVFEMLLAAGANPASTARDGTTTVMAAARSGSVAILRLLLALRLDANTQDQQGYTALMHAAHEGMAQTVALLLAHGANPALLAADGSTALDVSRLYRYPGHVAAEALIERALSSHSRAAQASTRRSRRTPDGIGFLTGNRHTSLRAFYDKRHYPVRLTCGWNCIALQNAQAVVDLRQRGLNIRPELLPLADQVMHLHTGVVLQPAFQVRLAVQPSG
jgi:hypothetical protein